jgi:small-conductance mechanosensitive channel
VQNLLTRFPFLDVTQWSHATQTTVRIALIVVFAWIAIGILQRAIRLFRQRIAARLDDREAVKRAETLGRVFRYVVAVVVSLVAGMMSSRSPAMRDWSRRSRCATPGCATTTATCTTCPTA